MFGNFQKMFGNISCSESSGRFWRIYLNLQKVVRNLPTFKIIYNVVIRRVCLQYNLNKIIHGCWWVQVHVLSLIDYFYVMSECTVCSARMCYPHVSQSNVSAVVSLHVPRCSLSFCFCFIYACLQLDKGLNRYCSWVRFLAQYTTLPT